MALNGIPIDPQQAMGDSLVVLNNSFIELDSRTLSLSGLIGTSSGNLYTTIQDVSGNLYTLIQESSANQTVPVKFTFTGNGSQVSFPLTGTNLSTDAVSYRVDVNGVIQEPNADYNISGSDLIFTSAPPVGTKIVVVTAENYANMTITLSGFDTGVRAISANWQNTYTDFSTNSASYATTSFANTKFLPLSGGIVSGDLTITGNLSTLGITTQIDTQVFVTSAVSVTNTGTGPALAVRQTGSQDIATFFDDSNTALVIKDGGNVGIGTFTPNEKLTISGNISASGNINIQSVTVPVSVINLTNNRTFISSDTNKIFHFDTTSNSLSAIFSSTLSDGFNVAIVNTGTNSLHLSAASLKSFDTVLANQYSGAFVYKQTDIFAFGGF